MQTNENKHDNFKNLNSDRSHDPSSNEPRKPNFSKYSKPLQMVDASQ